MKRFFLLYIGFFLISLSSSTAQAEPTPDIAELTRKAESGDLNAETALARCYIAGIGVDKNMQLGLNWTLKAAQQGSSSAQAGLGLAYLYGAGSLNKNEEEAVKWLTLSANKEYAPAQRLLSDCYIDGKGVSKNEKLGLEYLIKAAIGGDDIAQLKLSENYRAGKLLPEDKKLSFEWAEKSAAQGNVNAIMKVAAYYEGGYYVDKDGEKAFKYQLLAAEKGSLGAAYAVGVHYSTGNGIKSDRNESIKWFKVAAYGGLIEAQKTLIYIYAKGDGVPRDYIESLAWTYIVGSNGRDEDKEKIDELEKAAGQETAIKAQERARLILADIKRVNPDYKPQSFFENMGIAKEICENKEVPSSESNDVGIAKAYYYSNLKEFAKDGKVLPFIEVKDKILKTLRNQ